MTPSFRATMLKRLSPTTSEAKNSRRHGAGNDTLSMRCTASTSAGVASTIWSASSGILFLQQLHFRFGQPHVNRRDVAVAIAFASLDDLDRAPRAAESHVVALHDVGHANHPAILGRYPEVRRRRLACVIEMRNIQLPSPRIVDDRHTS